MKCRTVTCAPTNIAVIEVATRLLRLVRQSIEFVSYGLGDIVLFGNGERMKIDNHDDLVDYFLISMSISWPSVLLLFLVGNIL